MSWGLCVGVLGRFIIIIIIIIINIIKCIAWSVGQVSRS